ncbi:unnamed protein product [Phyllotreta striolata]|uniref:Protein-tyrosine-phosphatase n=1 Tax=Phyllotreta striolata TaxID=444603 RepID=A0A9N9XJH0_PHYSR|nr:unnamed protein product [Phyllotreta striolata]
MSIFSRISNLSSRMRSYPDNLDMIEPNLYLSGEAEARNVETLKKFKITHILTINDYPLTSTVKEALPYLQMKYIRLSDITTSDLMAYFDETYEFIREGVTRGAVLVHCQMGVSRSATIVIAYLMKKYNISFREALDRVKMKRCVFPNQGFIAQLENYRIMGCSTMRRYEPKSSRYYMR